jgi:Fe-Mn family superoxide dismutase
LNAAIAGTDMEGKTIENILNLDMKNMLRNNGGGFYNHNLFWTVMTPNGGGLPTRLLAALETFENLKASFSKAGATQFGSGWAWLCTKGGKVEVCGTQTKTIL